MNKTPIEGTFGTVAIEVTENVKEGANTWSKLDVTNSTEFILPGSTIELTGASVTNSSNVAIYVKIGLENLKAFVGDSTDPANASNIFDGTLTFAVTDDKDAALTAVEGYDDMYLLTVGTNLKMGNVSLAIKDSVTNDGAVEGIGNGSKLTVSYDLSVYAVQADNITEQEASDALDALMA